MTNDDIEAHQERVSKITEAILSLDMRTAGDISVNYKALYYALFNDLTDAIDDLESSGGECDALTKLIQMQQRSEARFIVYPYNAL